MPSPHAARAPPTAPPRPPRAAPAGLCVCARGGAGWLFPAVRACVHARAQRWTGWRVGLAGYPRRAAQAPPPRFQGGGEGTLLVAVDPEGAQERAIRSEAELLQRPAARLAHRRPHEARVRPARGLRRDRRGEGQSRRRSAGAASAPRRARMVPRRARMVPRRVCALRGGGGAHMQVASRRGHPRGKPQRVVPAPGGGGRCARCWRAACPISTE